MELVGFTFQSVSCQGFAIPLINSPAGFTETHLGKIFLGLHLDEWFEAQSTQSYSSMFLNRKAFKQDGAEVQAFTVHFSGLCFTYEDGGPSALSLGMRQGHCTVCYSIQLSSKLC